MKNISSSQTAKPSFKCLYSGIFSSLLLAAFFLFLPTQTSAITTGEMPIGTIIQMSGMQFVKVTSNCLFVGLKNYTRGKNMQDFTSEDCQNLTTCTVGGSNCATNGSTVALVDSRDSKVYHVRKFADGNCWMIDNLAYGGGTDGHSDYCSNKTSWRNAISGIDYVSATATNGLNPSDGSRNLLVGDCRGNIGTNNSGYYYNWVAAIQNTAGWGGCTSYNTNCTTNSFQPTQPTTGICPAGWQLPTGGQQIGNFYQLYLALGGDSDGDCTSTEASPNENCVKLTNNFNNPSYFNHLYVGLVFPSGAQGGNSTYYWSSTQKTDRLGHAFNLYFSKNYLARTSATTNDPKNYGFLVRCLFSP